MIDDLKVESQIPNNAGDHVREVVNNQRNDHNIYSSGVATERDRFMGSSIDRDAGVSDIGSRLRPAAPRANAARYNVMGGGGGGRGGEFVFTVFAEQACTGTTGTLGRCSAPL